MRNLTIDNGKIIAVTDQPIGDKEMIDAAGLVVAPGFIDTHHANEKGPSADMLIHSENPFEDMAVVEDHENNQKRLMEDGRIYSNAI